MHLDDSSLVPGSDAVQIAVRSVLDHVVSRTRDALGDHCRAILLGGSLARSQGMAYRDGDEHRLLSDLDIYVVRGRARGATEAMLGRELRERVATDPRIASPLDLAFTTVEHLRAGAHTLHMQQLRHGCILLYGDSDYDVGSLIPQADVSIDEARRLLLNRICESVWLRTRSADIVSVSHGLKLLIDAPLAMLASWGGYVPTRSGQRARLRDLLAPASEEARASLERGLEMGERWRDAALRQPMTLQQWGDWSSKANAILTSFVLSTLRAVLSARSGAALDPVREWEKAAADRGFEPRDAARLGRWCRRGGRAATLRRARQWAPLAPRPITPWWRHGMGGSGADRVYAAGVLRWFDQPDWERTLRGLVRELPSAPEGEMDAWFGRLWSDWILGEGRR